jgi:probable rRNA maturation factor
MILFFTEEIDFQLLRKNSWKSWIKDVCKKHGVNAGELNYIFCSDEYLLKINRQYLDHDYYTDIITFPSDCEDGNISGDLFISVDRISDHAELNQCSFFEELKRVMIHGVLHLIGYGDKTESESEKMRELELDAMLMFHVEHETNFYKANVPRGTKQE